MKKIKLCVFLILIYLFPAIAVPINGIIIIDNSLNADIDMEKILNGTPPLNDSSVSYKIMKGDINSGKSADAGYIIHIRKTKKANTDFIEGTIFPKGATEPLYTAREQFSNLTFNESIKQVLVRTHLRINNKLDYIRKLIIGHDKKNNPLLTWDSPLNSDYYEIYRSKFRDKDFAVIGKSAEKNFTDPDTEQGLQYWYMIKPLNPSMSYDFSDAVSGYRKPAEPAYENLDKLLNLKTVTVKKQQGADIKREEFLKQFYWNEIKLRLILNLAKPYTLKGKLKIIKTGSDYTIDKKKKSVTVSAKNMVITFKSKSLFKLYSKYEKYNPDDLKQLMNIIMANSAIFCIYDGLKEIKNNDGTVSFVHQYRGAGLTGEYVKNRKDWKSHTLLFSTSDKEIKKEIQKVQKKSD